MNRLRTLASYSLTGILFACHGMDPSEFGEVDDTSAIVPPGIVADAYATNGTELRAFRVDLPNRPLARRAITGLQRGEEVRGIDFRPATGELFAITNQSRLYVIDPATGNAIQRGVDGAFTVTSPDDIGFDFNPVPDRIRVVGTDGQNLRLNPNDGALAATDGALNGATTNARAAAYTNSFAGLPSPTATTLYVFSVDPDGRPALFVQNPPNAGTTVRVGRANVGLIGARAVSFDITAPNTGYLLVTRGASDTAAAELFRIDLDTAAVTSIGFVPSLGTVRGFALVPPQRPAATAYVTDGANLRGITLDNPGFTLTSAPISGLEAGELVRGIDFRPATGELFAITDRARLLVIDPATGASVQRGSGGTFALGAAQDPGFDFNPVPDRIRVVDATGANLRLNPNDGNVAAVDGNINGATAGLRAAAYTNSFRSATPPTSTTLFVANVDVSGAATLYAQTPPNAGTTIAVGALDLGAPIAGGLSFDIRAPSDGFIVVNRGASAQLYRVELATGATSVAGTFAGTSELRGLAIIPPPAQ